MTKRRPGSSIALSGVGRKRRTSTTPRASCEPVGGVGNLVPIRRRLDDPPLHSQAFEVGTSIPEHVGRVNNDRHVSQPPLAANEPNDVESVHARHVAIEDDQGGRVVSQVGDRLPTAMRLHRVVPEPLEQPHDGVARVAVVIDHEDHTGEATRGRPCFGTPDLH
jgi:hypothetical protein